MVGIGVAACGSCGCNYAAGCCFPADEVAFTLVSDPDCPLDGEVVTITRTDYDTSGETTTHEPNGNVIWVGTYDSSSICDDVDEIKVIMYCATIAEEFNWCAELYCDGVRQATICTTDFTCTDGELTAALFLSADLGALCCGCAGLPCGAGGSVGSVTLPLNCTPVTTACCSDTMPALMYITFTDTGVGLQACPCLDGVTLELTYNSGTNKWEYSGTPAGCSSNYPIEIELYCSGSTWTMRFHGGGVDSDHSYGNVVTSCDPFEFSGDIVTIGMCDPIRGTNLSFVVTE